MSSLSTKFKVPGSAEKQKSQVIGRGYHSYHGVQTSVQIKLSACHQVTSLPWRFARLASRVVSGVAKHRTIVECIRKSLDGFLLFGSQVGPTR